MTRKGKSDPYEAGPISKTNLNVNETAEILSINPLYPPNLGGL
jgi:hypothetical protein